MTKIITENFRVETAKEFLGSFELENDSSTATFRLNLTNYNEDANLQLSNTNVDTIVGFANAQIQSVNDENVYYVMAASVTPNDPISNTQRSKRDFQRRVIFGDKLLTRNIKYIFQNEEWTSNTVYDSFDDQVDSEQASTFITVLDGDPGEGPYRIFKCIRNNAGQPSTVAPSASNADLDVNNETTLADGYVWKYMFDVPAAEYIEYGLTGGLPYVANTEVIDSAEETVSDIVIEDAIPNQFSDYIIGLADANTNTIIPSEVESISPDNTAINRYRIIIRTAVDARTEDDAYVGMYFRLISPGQANAVYDILDTEISPGNANRLSVFVESDVDLTTVSPSLINSQCDIVPKIEVTRSTGRRCIAYGELDSNGTLSYVQFVDKGTQYKYAEATLSLPPSLQDDTSTTLRAIVSSRGGHGSDPITEMLMSRVASVTNFFSSQLTNIPSNNQYTAVGLIKNPVFYDNTHPADFDNRLLLSVPGDVTSNVLQNYFVTQVVEIDGGGQDTVSGLVHEISYDSDANTSSIFLVDYDGPYVGVFEPGDAEAKQTLDATEIEPITINTVSDRAYVPFSGDLLHFIDFEPIERRGDRKEKIKFVFDF